MYKIQHIPPILLDGVTKVEHYNYWRTSHESNSWLENKRVQGLSIIRFQWMQVLLEKMKHDPYWYNISESYNPLTLLKLTEKKNGSDR